jgi:hypothetical protein
MGVFSQLQERIYSKNAQQIIWRNVEHVVIKLWCLYFWGMALLRSKHYNEQGQPNDKPYRAI